MHKRKNIGILKYGKILSKPTRTQKFQEGGVASVASGYDWRDDPYELMLLQQEAAGNRYGRRGGSGRKSSTTKAAKPPNIDDIPRLEGGLRGTNLRLNAEYSKLQNDYYAGVQNGTIDVNSVSGQQAFNNLINQGIAYQDQLDREKSQFDRALKNVKDTDRDALAISTNNQMFVADKEGKKGVISVGEYLNNIDNYSTLKIKDFIDWKENNDTSGNTGMINEFLVGGSMSPEGVYDEFIKPKLDLYSYKIHGNNIVPQNAKKDDKFKATDAISSTSQWQETLRSIARGQDPTSVNANTQDAIIKATDTLYGEIMANSGDRSRLQTSLYSEVLSDRRHQQAIAALPTAQEKQAYLVNQSKIALVNKLFDKGTGAPKGSDDEGPSPGGKLDMNPTVGAFAALADGTQIKQYLYEDEFDSGEEGKKFDLRKGGIKVPMLSNVVSSAKLNIPTGKEAIEKTDASQNKVHRNTALDTLAETDSIYFENGAKVKDIAGTPSAAAAYVNDYMRLHPYTKVDIVWVAQDGKGNITMHETEKIAKIKLESKRDFLNAWNSTIKEYPSLGLKPFSIKANQMVAGTTNEEAIRANKAYLEWVKAGKDSQETDRRLEKDPSSVPARFKRALGITADKSYEKALTGLKGMDTKMLVPMARVKVILGDGNGINIKEAVDGYSKSHKGYGLNSVKETDYADAEDYMENTQSDPDNEWWLLKQKEYETNILMPVKTLSKQAAESGKGKVEHLMDAIGIDADTKKKVNQASYLTNPEDPKNMYNFLMNQ